MIVGEGNEDICILYIFKSSNTSMKEVVANIITVNYVRVSQWQAMIQTLNNYSKDIFKRKQSLLVMVSVEWGKK